MTDDARPKPEALLSRLKADDERAHRGKLKIFFGSSAGVGKTYSMLSAAHELLAQGIDVIVGFVETHQRPYTEKLLEGLDILTPLMIRYQGVLMKEFNLDGALARKPNTILVDELAHTNVQGSRHPKRWNDVIELLDAGINVYTTLNVQHLESLSDLVAGTTGIWVKETVPDSVFDMADDVVLVDIDSDDLLKRLHEGNVYIAPGANKRAAENFFKKVNLNALREIALRRTAQRVDAERDPFTESSKLPIADKILVCVGTDEMSAKLIRATKRLATALKAPWTALYVDKGDPQSAMSDEKRRVIELLERMVSRLDGKMITLYGSNIADEVLSYAKQNNITKIIIGKHSKVSINNIFDSFLTSNIIKRSGAIDVIIITDDRTIEREKITTSFFSNFRPLNYILAALAVVCFTIPGYFLPNVLTETDQALLYLTGIVVVAESFGLGPSLLYAFMAAAFFHIFFQAQHLIYSTDQRAYFMTFLVMLVTGYGIATKSSSLKAQAIAARDKESRTQALFELTRKLTATRGRFPVSEVVATYLSKLHNVDTTVWMTNADGHPSVILGALPESTYHKDFGALQWCIENAKVAGRGTSTMPSASGFYIPLITGNGTLGVLGAFPRDNSRLFTNDETSSLETIGGLLASALERVRAGEIAAQAIVEKENAKLKESLLSAFDSDLRTPLETLSGSVSTLLGPKEELNTYMLKDVAASINLEAKRFQKSVSKLLDASSIEAGTIDLNRVPASLHDLVDRSIVKNATILDHREVKKLLPDDLPDVLVDAILAEQVITNILDNAARYSPPQTPITIEALRHGGEVIISVSDQGPGIPKGYEAKIFDKFCALPHSGYQGGTGLGLTISAGIIRLHAGRIWAENQASGGAKLSFTFPIA